MNKLILIVTLLCFSTIPYSFSQKLLKSISDDTCDCISEKFAENKEIDIDHVFEACLKPAMLKRESKLRKEYGEDFFTVNESNARNLGIEIGKIMAKDCNAFIDIVIAQQQQEERSAEDFYNKGKEEVENGNYKNALTYLDKAIDLEIDNANFLNERGNIYYLLGDYYHAVSDFIRATEHNDAKPVYYYNIAYSMYKHGDYKQSLKYADITLKKEITYCNAYNLKGLIYSQLDKQDSSLVFFGQAHDCDKSDPVKSYNVGYTLHQLKQYDEALEWLKIALDSGYTGTQIYSYIGNCHYQLEEYEVAKEFHVKHLAHDSTNYIPHYNLGLCEYYLKNYDKSISHFERAYVLDAENSDIPYFLSKNYTAVNELDSALSYIDEAILINPTDANLYDNRAEIHSKMGNHQKTIIDYSTSLSLYPDDCSIYLRIAETHEKLGAKKEAADFRKKAVNAGCEE